MQTMGSTAWPSVYIHIHMLVLSSGLNSSPTLVSPVSDAGPGTLLFLICLSGSANWGVLAADRKAEGGRRDMLLPVCLLFLSVTATIFHPRSDSFSSSSHWFQFVVLKTFLELVFLHSFQRHQHQSASVLP